MIISPNDLEEATLDAIIEQFVLGEGTEYGARDYSLAEKVQQVRRQIHAGDVVIVWSEVHETIGLMAKDQLEKND